ncbi:MAG: ribonuclease H-like YkuK family protein, partial [Betaproteobacteria bacterium]
MPSSLQTQYRSRIDLEQVKCFIEAQSAETRIYIGADSHRLVIGNTWYADYTLAIVVHINGKNGCKLFGEVVRERDYDQKKDKPQFRLMNEVYKVADLYLKLADVLSDRHVEVHLD